MGACRRQELYELKYDDVKNIGETFLVQLVNTKNKKPRSFTITGKYYNICKQYVNLRPNECQNPQFFLNFQNKKCTVQTVGINKIGNMGKHIASYLNLPDAQCYTGHCFRRSSATLLVDNGGDILTLKRHGGWQSTSVAESYIDESLQNKIEISNKLLPSVETKINNVQIHEKSSTHICETSIPQITFTNCTIHNVYVGQKEDNCER